jgi:CBS domain-containing protein
MPTAASLLQDKANDHRGGEVATIEPEATVLDAARKMNERRIGSLAVVDGAGKLIGMFTERDVLTRIVAGEKDAATTRVGDVMTAPVIACPPTARADEMRAIMREKRIRHLPIVEGKALIGLISIGDLNLAEAKTLEATVTYLERYMYMP